MPTNMGHFYQIGQSEKQRGEAAKILSVQPAAMIQSHFRGRELLHSEECALWTDYFHKTLPSANVIRDFHFSQYPHVNQALMITREEFDFKPDIVLTLCGADREHDVNIAIEIERTLKTKARLFKKLNKYASETKIDGLIYVCRDMHISQTLGDIYNARVLQKAQRINHYGDNFILFSKSTALNDAGEPIMLNAKLELVSLSAWINYLAANHPLDRRDSNVSIGP